jgi:hypothetical protein
VAAILGVPKLMPGFAQQILAMHRRMAGGKKDLASE